MPLKNLFVFYVFLSVPIALLSLGAKFDYINSGTFVSLLFTYAVLYHPFICGLRLVQSGKTNKRDLWKNFIPFWNDKYWTFLFFNK